MITPIKIEGNSIFFKIEGILEDICDSIIEYLMFYSPCTENIEIVYDLEYLSAERACLIKATLHFKDTNINHIQDIIENEKNGISEYYN